MHPVADKMKLKQFEGELSIMGKSRGVAFSAEYGKAGEPGHEPSTLTIAGLSMEEAWDALSRLVGPVAVQEKPAAKAETKTEAKKEEPKKDPPKEQPKAETKPATNGTNGKTVAPPKEEAKEESAEDDLDDLGDEAGEATPMDVAFMAKQEKLRPVIEHMIKCGHKSVEAIVAAAGTVKDEVPTLKLLVEKGGFDKRVERAALVVLGGE